MFEDTMNIPTVLFYIIMVFAGWGFGDIVGKLIFG